MKLVLNKNEINLFDIKSDLLPERFSIVGFIQDYKNDYVVMGRETGDFYCTWLYNPACGFTYGHYRLTKEEAYKDMLNRLR